jgi:hypothetical protein
MRMRRLYFGVLVAVGLLVAACGGGGGGGSPLPPSGSGTPGTIAGATPYPIKLDPQLVSLCQAVTPAPGSGYTLCGRVVADDDHGSFGVVAANYPGAVYPWPTGVGQTVPVYGAPNPYGVPAGPGQSWPGQQVLLLPYPTGTPCAPNPQAHSTLDDGCATPLPSPQATTDSNGRFVLGNVPAGTYLLVVGAQAEHFYTSPPGYSYPTPPDELPTACPSPTPPGGYVGVYPNTTSCPMIDSPAPATVQAVFHQVITVPPTSTDTTQGSQWVTPAPGDPGVYIAVGATMPPNNYKVSASSPPPSAGGWMSMGANTQSYPTPNPLPQPWESDGDFYLSIANPMYEAPCYFQVNDARARLDPQSPSYAQYGPTPSGVILDELLLAQSRERVAAMANPYSAQFATTPQNGSNTFDVLGYFAASPGGQGAIFLCYLNGVEDDLGLGPIGAGNYMDPLAFPWTLWWGMTMLYGGWTGVPALYYEVGTFASHSSFHDPRADNAAVQSIDGNINTISSGQIPFFPPWP